jgi:hypothetical protein
MVVLPLNSVINFKYHFKSFLASVFKFDDIGTAETVDKTEEGYDNLKNLINNLGFEIAEQKCCSPSTSMIFLGKQFDSVNMSIKFI